ncbi:hypothetical protein AB1Y20_009575 [Prymnesium parvum]|uniref:Nudix hydrolase domain-containing protein n=1 Tax=Prymnesium parvum TaxID=97485 RepID=A0AB34K1V4_PRYPA
MLVAPLVTLSFLSPWLATSRPPLRTPPPLLSETDRPAVDAAPAADRSADVSGYRVPPERVTWAPFTYASPQERRSHALRRRQHISTTLPPMPPLVLMVIGGPSSGKGTIVPMLAQALRARAVSVGNLLRGEIRAARPRGLAAAAAMARGELVPDALTLELLHERVLSFADAAHVGWIFDGFPRVASQAAAVLAPEYARLRPDGVILLERPAELIKEFALGRCTDSLTGQTYHPTYAPPPDELRGRLVWRVDDTQEVVERRLAEHEAAVRAVRAEFDAAGVPLRAFDNARSELHTFDEVVAFVEELGMLKLAAQRDAILARWLREDADVSWGVGSSAFEGYGSFGGPQLQDGLLNRAEALVAAAANLEAKVSDEREADVEAFCEMDEEEGACLVRYEEEAAESCGLLLAVRRCNEYDPAKYRPVVVDEAVVGWVSEEMVEHLAPQVALGTSCELALLKGRPALRLAPDATSAASRTRAVAELVAELVADGVVPAGKVRHELQDVHAISDGFVAPGGPPPLLQMERAAMIHFGIPSYGVHVNGYIRNPDNPADPRPWAVWVGKRAASKNTYPGLLDQMVAGGQPTGLSFMENVRKECEEEASLPPAVVDAVRATGVISYRYSARRGLSSKVLATFDVEMPAKLPPICADGEVEEFKLMTVEQMLTSIREELPLWKPNSALVAVDFALRHGYLSPDSPSFVEVAHLLRAAGFRGFE